MAFSSTCVGGARPGGQCHVSLKSSQSQFFFLFFFFFTFHFSPFTIVVDSYIPPAPTAPTPPPPLPFVTQHSEVLPRYFSPKKQQHDRCHRSTDGWLDVYRMEDACNNAGWINKSIFDRSIDRSISIDRSRSIGGSSTPTPSCASRPWAPPSPPRPASWQSGRAPCVRASCCSPPADPGMRGRCW